MNPTRAALIAARALQRAVHADKHVPTLRANIRAAMRRALLDSTAYVQRHGALKIDAGTRKLWATEIWRAMHGRMFYMANHGYLLAGGETGAKGKSHGVHGVLFNASRRGTSVGKASEGGVEVREDKSAFLQNTDWRGLDRWINTTAESASRTLADKMQAIFEDAAAFVDPDTGRGKTPADIAKELMSLGETMTDERASMLARTGAIYGYNEGAMQRYADDGVAVVEWLTAEDDMACEMCAELNGKRVDTKESFMDAGKWDVKHPPAHPNCRCTLVPIVDEGQLEGRKNLEEKEPIQSAPDEPLVLAMQGTPDKPQIIPRNPFTLNAPPSPVPPGAPPPNAAPVQNPWFVPQQQAGLGPPPAPIAAPPPPRVGQTHLEAVIESTEKQIETRGIEESFTLDANGKLLHYNYGTNKTVIIDAVPGATVTHNHPSGYSFSDADVKALVDGKLHEFRACGNGTVYSMKTVPGTTPPTAAEVQAAYDAQIPAMQAAARKHVASGLTRDEALRRVSHDLWSTLAPQLNLDYSRRPL